MAALHSETGSATMVDLGQKLFQELQEKLPGLAALLPKKEIEAVIQSALSRLDLVTREEFDAQTAVLQRTRARLEALEQQLAELESRQL